MVMFMDCGWFAAYVGRKLVYYGKNYNLALKRAGLA